MAEKEKEKKKKKKIRGCHRFCEGLHLWYGHTWYGAARPEDTFQHGASLYSYHHGRHVGCSHTPPLLFTPTPAARGASNHHLEAKDAERKGFCGEHVLNIPGGCPRVTVFSRAVGLPLQPLGQNRCPDDFPDRFHPDSLRLKRRNYVTFRYL